MSAVAAVCCGALVACGARGRAPQALARPSAPPAGASWRDGAWYWIEQPARAQAHLVRAGAGSVVTLASAESFHGYDAEAGRAAWAAQRGGRWFVETAPAAGGDPVAVWSGTERAGGVRFADGVLYWAQSVPAAVSPAPVPPPLQARTRIMALAGAIRPTVVAELMETGRVVVLGAHAGALYVAAYRPEAPGSTAFYRVPLSGARPERIASENREPDALLARDGALYWAAPSLEAADQASAACVRRLRPGGAVENLSDWLPAPGRLCETDRGVVYVDRTFAPALWSMGRNDRLPEATAVPEGYEPVAAGPREVLLASAPAPRKPLVLYRWGF